MTLVTLSLVSRGATDGLATILATSVRHSNGPVYLVGAERMKFTVYYTVTETRSVEVMAANQHDAVNKVTSGEAHDSQKNYLYGTDRFVKAEFGKVLLAEPIEKVTL